MRGYAPIPGDYGLTKDQITGTEVGNARPLAPLLRGPVGVLDWASMSPRRSGPISFRPAGGCFADSTSFGVSHVVVLRSLDLTPKPRAPSAGAGSRAKRSRRAGGSRLTGTSGRCQAGGQKQCRMTKCPAGRRRGAELSARDLDGLDRSLKCSGGLWWPLGTSLGRGRPI